MIEINEIDHPEIQIFRSLRDNILKNEDQIIVESEKVVLKLLETDIEIIKAFLTHNFFEKHRYLIEQRIAHISKIFLTDKKIMKQIVGYNVHQGAMMLANRPQNTPINEITFPVLVLNGLTQLENVGTIIRNARAFGINSIIVDTTTCNPWHRRCIRVSMGNVFYMNIHSTENLEKTINNMKKQNIKITGTTGKVIAKNIHDHTFVKNCAVIIGSEGNGIAPEIAKICDDFVRIPVLQNVSSINAACAAGIMLYKMNVDLSILK